MTLRVDETVARVPQWNGRQDIRTSFLAGGITNQNFKVEVGAEAFVLRIGGANTELLGVNRDVEVEASRAAARIGIAPEVIHVIEPEHYLITRFVEGQSITPEAIRQPEHIRRVIDALKQIHALPPVNCEFNAFRYAENCTQIAADYEVMFPSSFDAIMARAREIEQALASDRSALRLCHNDLLNANFLIGSEDGRLTILDWEYAGMGDPFFDLANFTANHEFSNEQDRLVLEAYFGEATAQNRAHLKLMQIMSDLREAMWGMVQIGISKLAFDFRAYADKHFARLLGRLDDPEYARWLGDVRP